MLTTFKRWIQSLIGLTGREANAFVILIPAIFLVIFSQPFYRWLSTGSEPLSIKETMLLDSAMERAVPKVKPTEDATLFMFDPNSATKAELISLGIRDAVASRIEQYRAKGGKFRIRADFAKMYGLDSILYVRLKPFIDLPDAVPKKGSIATTEAPKRVIEYDLNKADTADLKSVKGIGTVLALRIIKYRSGLGGFIEMAQLKEVYGLDSLVIRELSRFYVDKGFTPSTLAINQASDQDLDKHPYVSLKQAKAIVTYRSQHGPYRSLDDLRKVKLLNEELLTRIGPYLSFE